MKTIYLGIGSNLGRRERFLDEAVRLINLHIGKVSARSSIYETQAWGMEDAPDFLNAVVEVETGWSAHEVMAACLRIERMLGRNRKHIKLGYSSRTIDIDVLYFADEIHHTPDLVVPHPGIPRRRFVLEPLVALAPHFKCPTTGKTTTELLAICTDITAARLWQSPTVTSV